MWDIYGYGKAAMEERWHDRRLAEVENYLRMEYGSTSGMGRYIAEANHTSSPRSGLRAFLAKIAGVASRFSNRVKTPASVEPALSEGYADPAARQPHPAMTPRVQTLGHRRGPTVKARTAVSPLKR